MPAQQTPMFACVFRLIDPITWYETHCKEKDKDEVHSHEKGQCLPGMRPTMAGFKNGIPGRIAIDIDRDNKAKTFEQNVGDAIVDLRIILHRLEESGVRKTSFVIFFSGSKGFHVEFQAEAFGSAIFPSFEVDPVLEAMFKAELEADEVKERAKASKTRQNADAPAKRTAQSIQISVPPPERKESIVKRVESHFPGFRRWLQMAWFSKPRPDKPNNTSSDFDFRLGTELFLLGWNEQDVADAILLRPSSSASFKRAQNLQRTINSCLKYAQTQ